MKVASSRRSQALHVSRRQLATSSCHRRLMPTDTISTKTEAGKSILIAELPNLLAFTVGR